MNSHIRNPKGFSIVEMIFSLFIFTLFITAVTGTFIMAGRMKLEAETKSSVMSEASYVMDMIQRGDSGLFGLMKARSGTVTISAAGDQVDFMADKNVFYTDTVADDTAMSIYFDNGDGNDATLEDNVVIIDPGGGGALIELGSNIEALIFDQIGDVVSVQLTVTEMVRGRPFRMTMDRNIWIRN